MYDVASDGLPLDAAGANPAILSGRDVDDGDRADFELAIGTRTETCAASQIPKNTRISLPCILRVATRYCGLICMYISCISVGHHENYFL